MKRLLLASCFISFASAEFAQAQPNAQNPSPVDTSSPLETIATDFGLADGPAWDGSRLFFPDVKGNAIHVYHPKSNKVAVINDNAGRISATFFNHGVLHLSDNGNARISEFVNEGRRFATGGTDAQPAKPNDLVVDHHGGIYYTLTREGRVEYRDTRTGKLSVAAEGIKTPNGIILSPDEKTLYVAAYVPKEIWAYEVTVPGETVNGRLLATMDDGDAKGADGMTIDRAGNIYCAGATDVWIWNPAGELIGKIPCPSRPINCAFGDNDMRSLYITGFGGLYRQRMTICGRSSHPPSSESRAAKNSPRPATTIPNSVRADLDVVYAAHGQRKMLVDIFRPADSGRRPAILVVHGGGWLNGDKTKFRALAVQLAARGYVTAAVEYRLGGEARFPAAMHDCNTAVRFLRAHADEYGIDPLKIGAVGGSAGGHIVGLMSTASDEEALLGHEHSDQSSKLQAAIVMAGPMQMASGSVAMKSRQQPEKSNSNKWLGKTIDEATDLYRLADAYEHISADDPPLLFMVGEHDQPERNQPSRDRFKEAGVWTDVKVYADGKHGCWNQLPWFNEMLDDMDAFFVEHLQ